MEKKGLVAEISSIEELKEDTEGLEILESSVSSG